MRIVILAVTAWMLGSLAVQAQSCPPPPAGAKPGWFAEVRPINSRSTGLMPDAPNSTFAIARLPTRFGDLPGNRGGGAIVKFTLKSNWVVCEAGRYELSAVVQAASQGQERALLCVGILDIDEGRVLALNAPNTMMFIRKGTTEIRAGAVQLEPGVHTMNFLIGCGVQNFGGMTTVMKNPDEDYYSAAFALRVRGPNENAPRDFRSNEIFQRLN